MIKYIVTGIIAISTMVMGAEISSVSPSSVELGTSNITVTFKLGSDSGDEESTDDQSSRGGGKQGGQRGKGGPGGQKSSSSSDSQRGGGDKPAGMLPPTSLLPNSVTIGNISGTSIAHTSSYTVTAVFDIPSDSSTGKQKAVITFTDPMGQPDVYSSEGFVITNR
jgi:hypothetical protein